MTCGCAEEACLAILRTTRASTRTDLRGPVRELGGISLFLCTG